MWTMVYWRMFCLYNSYKITCIWCDLNLILNKWTLKMYSVHHTLKINHMWNWCSDNVYANIIIYNPWSLLFYYCMCLKSAIAYSIIQFMLIKYITSSLFLKNRNYFKNSVCWIMPLDLVSIISHFVVLLFSFHKFT